MLAALSVVLEAAGGSSRLSKAWAGLHLNGKRIDRLSTRLASLTHQDHTYTDRGRVVNHVDGGFLGAGRKMLK